MFEFTVMDHAYVLSWVPLIQGLVMLAVGFGVAGAITASIRELAGGYWIFGWAAMLLNGAMFLVSEHSLPHALYAGFLADAMFAPLMFMGALEFARRPASIWPLVAGVLAGLTRGLFYLVQSHELLVLHAVLFAPAFLFGSAIVVARAPKDAPLRRPITTLLMLCVGMEFWDAWCDWDSRANVVPWTVVVAICAPLAAFQIGSRLVAMHRTVVSAREALSRLRDQERLATVGTLAAGIAHQINNPIGAISMAVEYALVAKDDPDSDAVVNEALGTILEQSQRVGRIVKSVLQLARDERTAKWPEDLVPLVLRASELTRSYVEKLGGQLEIDVAKDPLPVFISPIEIEQIVVNLIRNAAESRPDGANVRVRTLLTTKSAEIEVEDDGSGIEQTKLSHVFDPFYTTRLREGGTGLGMSVAYRIVTDHQGQIEVDSEVGRGTCVRVRLPLYSDSSNRDSSAS